jgi:DNA invertase Pin-like site-specific DNA recombinase
MVGYARVSTTHQSLSAQHDRLVAEGVPADRIYSDKISGTRSSRPGLDAMLSYLREGDVVVLVGVDRLGRSAAEVMTTVKTLLDRGIVIRALREGVDSSTPTGRAVLGIMASLAELELELGKERRLAAREAAQARGEHVGRPRALSSDMEDAVRLMHADGKPMSAITSAFGISRTTAYRLIRQNTSV